MPKVVDTNVIIRYLLEDTPPQKLKQIRQFLSREKLIVTDVTIAEIVWVLDSYYHLPKNDTCDHITSLVNFENFIINRPLISKTIILWRQHNIDYIDAYLLAVTQKDSDGEIVSFDKSLDRIKGVKRAEP